MELRWRSMLLLLARGSAWTRCGHGCAGATASQELKRVGQLCKFCCTLASRSPATVDVSMVTTQSNPNLALSFTSNSRRQGP
ncbi:hypothetical protein E2562_003253 [Oryza meyeriana var. granulata]|uniref:Secreted protein n=1 Tax=Oryza meyeriana var. granulata TaxID=110450 RepID=A0A6G1EUZ8_9ORYZ|nr:hypothetical protein E2562_003253 [Oryza meyeriana var. granulata]